MSKKHDLKQPDQVQVAIEKVLVEANNNRGPIFIGIGVLVLLGAIYMGVSHNAEVRLEGLNLAYSEAAQKLVVARTEEDEATKAKLMAEAQDDIAQLYEAAQGEKLFPFVLSKQADLLFEQGKYIEVQGVLRELLAQDNLDPFLKSGAYYRLMKVYIAAYNLPEAMEVGRNALQDEEGPFSELIQAEMDRLKTGSYNQSLTNKLKEKELKALDIVPAAQ